MPSNEFETGPFWCRFLWTFWVHIPKMWLCHVSLNLTKLVCIIKIEMKVVWYKHIQNYGSCHNIMYTYEICEFNLWTCCAFITDNLLHLITQPNYFSLQNNIFFCDRKMFEKIFDIKIHLLHVKSVHILLYCRCNVQL